MIKELIIQCQDEIDKNGYCNYECEYYENPCEYCQYSKIINKLYICQIVRELYLKGSDNND